MIKKLFLGLLLVTSVALESVQAQEGFIGEIKMFAGNFAPRGWAFCDGSLLPINSNSALFSLVGTYYGGDGRTTFALPDLRSRIPMGSGNGAGLTPRQVGQKGGQETNTLTSRNLPAHRHTNNIPVWQEDLMKNDLDMKEGNDALLSVSNEANNALYNQTDDAGQATPQAFNIVQPYLVINYIICLQGTFPSRN